MAQILYDKIISVTLYKPFEKRVIYVTPASQSWKNKDGVLSVRATGNTTRGLDIYEGFSHTYQYSKIDATRKTSRLITKQFTARGPLFTFSNIDQLYYGVRPDGSPLQTGDKIRIANSKLKYHVVNHDTYVEGGNKVEGNTQDVASFNVHAIYGDDNNTREISTTAYTEKAIMDAPVYELKLECPEHGMKPDIAFSVNLLQGQACYKAVLKIRNLNTDAVNIREWKSMIIKAGYRTGKGTKEFICPIFTSYVESPNPDGVTVFEGITVGHTEDTMNTRQVRINFNKTETTVGELIQECSSAIAEGIEIQSTVPDDIWNIQINTEKRTVYAQNGLAVLNWLQSTLTEAVEKATSDGIHPGASLLIQYINGTLHVMVLNGENKPPVNPENIINLDMITSAVFNGTALSVTAPWNPALNPGDLFYMPPEFLNGSKLPNAIPESDYRNDSNLYRVITMNLQFATVQDTNQMSILAVPAQWTQSIRNNRTLDLNNAAITKMFQEAWDDRKGDKTEKLVNIGPLTNVEVSKLTQSTGAVAATGNPMFDETYNIVQLWGSSTSVTIPPGACLSMIAQDFYTQYCTAGKGKELQRYFYIAPGDPQYPANMHGAKTNNGIPAYILMWPLVATFTYWTKQNADKQGVDHNYTPIDLNNPDLIIEGRSLVMPTLPSSWLDAKMKSLKNIYKNAYNTYKDKYEGWATWWRIAYYYLGGTDEL